MQLQDSTFSISYAPVCVQWELLFWEHSVFNGFITWTYLFLTYLRKCGLLYRHNISEQIIELLLKVYAFCYTYSFITCRQ
jgi:hypothetical protein